MAYPVAGGGAAMPVAPVPREENSTVLKTVLLATLILGLTLSAITGSWLFLGVSIAVGVGFFALDCVGTAPPILMPIYNVIPPSFYTNYIRRVAAPFGGAPPGAYLARRVGHAPRHHVGG